MSPHVHKFQISPYDKCEEKNLKFSLFRFTLFCGERCFVAIFVWRIIEPKIVYVEKNYKYEVWPINFRNSPPLCTKIAQGYIVCSPVQFLEYIKNLILPKNYLIQCDIQN